VSQTKQDTVISLGATQLQTVITIVKEARFAILGGIILGFGRAISEVGAAMMIGGNIRGYTRVLTTAIALETSIGDLPLSIALGIILLLIALLVTGILFLVQER
jgi:tungstate transport system permease protein